MKYILNLSKENISVAGYQILANNHIIAIDDSIAERIQSDSKGKQLLKENRLVISHDLSKMEALKQAMMALDIDLNFNIAVDNYGGVKAKYFQFQDLLKKIENYKSDSFISKHINLEAKKNVVIEAQNSLNEFIKTNNNTLLESCREMKRNEIDTARNKSIESGVEYKGYLFQSAEKDRNLLTSTTSLFSIMGKVPDGFAWIAKDNTSVAMDLKELIELSTIMANSVSEHTYRARALKDSLNSMKTLKEIEAVKYDA